MPPFSPAAYAESQDQEEDQYRARGAQVPLDSDGADRPSFGERIAARQPSYMPKAAAPVPAENVQPPPIQLDPSKMPDILAGQNTNRVPAPPSQIPTINDLMRQRADLGNPLARNAIDPTTGKPLYKMGTGGRILGTVANFLSGFGGKGPVEYVGPGATNHRYDVDEADREKKLANVGTQIADQEKLADQNRKLYEASGLTQQREAKARELESQGQKYQNAIDPNSIEQDKTTGKWWGTNYGGQRQEVGPPKWAPENRPNKIADEGVERSQLADKYGLTGNARRDYILTGKLPKDMLGSQRQPTELETWMKAFKRDNGRDPSADEIAQRRARTRGTPAQFSKVEGDKKTGLLKAEKQYREDKLMGDPDADKNLGLAKQLAQEAYEQQIRELGGSAGGGNQVPNRGGGVQVTDPRGVVHTFPDQRSAEAFRKAARIR